MKLTGKIQTINKINNEILLTDLAKFVALFSQSARRSLFQVNKLLSQENAWY